MNTVSRIFRGLAVASLIAAIASLGCGDFVVNQGNLGKLVYALHTDYLVVEGDLEDVSLITDVEHRLNITPAKDADVTNPAGISHIMAPSDGVTITTEPAGDSVGDAVFTVGIPGQYTLQSWQGTELIDYIVLNFVEAQAIEVITYVREPDAEQFVRRDTDPVQAEVFSQATFIGKPVDAEGNDLVGDIGLEFAVVPADAAVEVYNLDAIYENGVWGSSTPINILFVATGDVSVVLTEKLTGLQKTISFTIAEPAVEQE